MHPGTKYGPDAPVFCCDEHMEPWLKTRHAQAMLAGAAMNDLGAALWAQRRSFVWFFIATAFVGIGLRLIARSTGNDGLDEFGAGIADLSIFLTFGLLAATWWSRRGGSDVG